MLEKNLPGISPALDAFIDDLANYDVSPDFGTDSMILRWRPDSAISWNLGTIVSSGQLWMDYMGQQAKNAGLGDSHKRYLESLAKLVPGATIKKTPQETAWNVAAQDGRIVRIDSLLADQTRKEGWLRAITDFQADVMKASENN